MIETLLPSPIIDPPLWLDARSHGKMTPGAVLFHAPSHVFQSPGGGENQLVQTGLPPGVAGHRRPPVLSLDRPPGAGAAAPPVRDVARGPGAGPSGAAPGDPRGPFADLLVRAEGDRRAGD